MVLSGQFSVQPDVASGRAHDGFLGLLNEEALAGGRAADALFDAGAGSREELLRANPSWLRVGTLRALLAYARQEFDRDPSLARELTEFVLQHVQEVAPPSEDTAFLVLQLHGTAWKEHGNALFMLSRLEEALSAANRSVEIFSTDPFHIVYRASARVLVALVMHAQHRNGEAILVLDEAIAVYAEHSEPRGYIAAIQVRAMIALDDSRYAQARDDYRAARSEAERIGDEREQIRIDHNLALCALRLGELEVARDYMTTSFLGFAKHRMDGELQRAIWLTAAIEKERGDLDVALELLHSVYGRFLERGMVTEAAQVLIQLGDVITEMTGRLDDAKEMCARLAVTLGRYDVPANVRVAVAHLKETSAAAASVAALRAALREVNAFLSEFLVSPSAVFHPAPTE